jgi:hypothetical protein
MKPFTTISGLIFLVVAVAHAWRLYTGWAVVAGPYTIPMWVSYVAVIVPLVLAAMLFREARS